MKVAFYTLGCKVNTYESEAIAELFVNNGYEQVDAKEYSDVYIINTCTVTNSGDAKSRKAIRKLIKQNPEAVVAVMGCYSQMDADAVASIDGVDIVIGTSHREQLLELVEEHLRHRLKIKEVTDMSRYRVFDEISVTSFHENTRAFLKIEDGCNHFCTYCIIPFARGRVRSRSRDSVLAEAKKLIQNNYHEIVLTGIHTGGYGQDLEDYSFYDLLSELSQLKDLKRLRISSIELNEITDEIIELIRKNEVFAKHLHIPLQSGSDEILKKMNRHYTMEEFKTRIQNIRKKIPGIAITTDIIVGFPGETDAHFEEMKQNIIDLSFSELHVFPYSRRSGTKAAEMKDQVHGTIKSIRVNELISLNEVLAEKFIREQQSTLQSVLFETSKDGYTIGHSSNYIRIKVKEDQTLHNQLRDVEIQEITYQDTIGEVRN